MGQTDNSLFRKGITSRSSVEWVTYDILGRGDTAPVSVYAAHLHVHKVGDQAHRMPSTIAPSTGSSPSRCTIGNDGIAHTEVQKPDLPYESLVVHYKPTTIGCMRPGAVFCGTQSNHDHTYEVRIEFTNVDLDTSTMGGYLKIRGLTSEWPEITTYFDGEIIGPHYKFITNKWNATMEDDLKHWSLFPHFPALHRQLGTFQQPFDSKRFPYIFMRWKERFLVPDHQVNHINGASFAGFYYICLVIDPKAASETDVYPGTSVPALAEDEISMEQEATTNPKKQAHLYGYYFHESSEPFQKLDLYQVPVPVSDTFELH